MPKGNDSKVKSDKKAPVKLLKEKRAAKAVKTKINQITRQLHH